MGDFLFVVRVVALSFLVGILSLDRVAFLQGMFHRPLVVSLFGGIILGNPSECLMVGVLLEVLWVARLPVGAVVPPDETVATLFGVCAVAALSLVRSVSVADVGLIVSVSVIAGELGKEADIFVRKVNGRISRYAKTAIELGDFKTFESSILASLFIWFLTSLVVSLILGFTGVALGGSVGEFFVPEQIRFFRIMYFIVPAIGAVSLYQHCRVGRRGTVFHTALASGALVFALFEIGVL